MSKLDKFMQNQGRGQFNYEAFKAMYDNDPKLKQLIKNFDKEKIELKQDEVDDVEKIPGNPGAPDQGISTAAKNATNLGDKL
jgi:predicted glycosyltransferase involved in capsule biosynthesis